MRNKASNKNAAAKKNALRGLRILHEDPDVIVVEKSAGILSQTLRHSDERSVESALTDYIRKGQWKSSRRAYLVHRLDRETSGVMMVAKNEQTQAWLRERWNEVTTKIYLARVEGTLDAERGVFESYLREDENYFVKSVSNPAFGKLARTEWEVVGNSEFGIPNSELETRNHELETRNRELETRNRELKKRNRESAKPATGDGHVGRTTTLVAVTLKSGRKNQIRAHFSEAGHPVLGDAKYGRGRRGDTLCLHAWKLSFRHPHSGKTLAFEAPPPSWTLEN